MRLLFLLAVLLLAGCETSLAPGLSVHDELSVIDRPRLEKAVAPLVRRGAFVQVTLARKASPLATSGVRNYVGVCVGLEPRYSEILVGDRWGEFVSLEPVRVRTLNPALQAGKYQDGIEGALGEVEAQLHREAFWRNALWGTILGSFGLWVLWTQFWRLCYRFDRSPPARLAFWLWDRTPWERAEQRRRAEREAAAVNAEVEQLARVREGVRDLPPELAARLAAFDAQPSRTEAENLRSALRDLENGRSQVRQLEQLLATLAKPPGKKAKEKLSEAGRAEVSDLRRRLTEQPELAFQLLQEARALWARELPASYAKAHPPTVEIATEAGSSYSPPVSEPSSSETCTTYSSGYENSASGDW